MKTNFRTAISKSCKAGLICLSFLTASSFINNARAQACALINSPNNLIKNSSFESNCNNWGTTNGNLYTGTGYQICGNNNGYLSSPGNGSPSWAFTEVDLKPAGTNLSFAGYFGTHTAGQSCNPIIRIAYYGSSWTLISADSKNITTNVDNPPYKPGLYVINSKVPAGTHHIRFEVRISCDYMKIDAVALTQVNLLPAELISFQAVLNNNNKASLTWKTASEVNFNYFTVEKSYDGINYNEAAVVFAAGSSTENSYSLNDNLASATSPVVYYRLRMTDNDGSVKYSDVRMIRIAKQTQATVDILTYPNPATSDVRITIPANWQNKRAVYEIINLNGQVVNRRDIANTSQTESISVSKLAPGMYFIKVSCEGQTAQQKIIKQ